MKRPKYLFLFFLIFSMLLISFRFLFFAAFIHVHKTEFRKQLLTDHVKEMVLFEFRADELFMDKNGVEWQEQNKELIVNGVFHEVISVVKDGKKVIVSAIPDQAENALFQKYFILNKQIRDNGCDLIKQLLNLICIQPRFQFEPGRSFDQREPERSKTCFETGSYRLRSIKPPEFLFRTIA